MSKSKPFLYRTAGFVSLAVVLLCVSYSIGAVVEKPKCTGKILKICNATEGNSCAKQPLINPTSCNGEIQTGPQCSMLTLPDKTPCANLVPIADKFLQCSERFGCKINAQKTACEQGVRTGMSEVSDSKSGPDCTCDE